MKTNNRKRFYQLLFSGVTLFILVSLFQLWSSSRVMGQNMMNEDMTMGLSMAKSMFSEMSIPDLFTPMGNMMGMMTGMMTNPVTDMLNLVLTLLVMIATSLLIGAIIILAIVWM
jgi:hypothetical protein